MVAIHTPLPGKSLSQTLNTDIYFSGRAAAKDSNLQKLIDLRKKADFAIHTAVDYGVQNLKGLADRGINTSQLADGEKAKMIYLTHHLGLGDAIAFIRREMSASTAKHLYEQQIGVDAAKKAADTFSGDYVAAHRNWLKNFIDKKIRLDQKMCDASSLVQARDLITLTDSFV